MRNLKSGNLREYAQNALKNEGKHFSSLIQLKAAMEGIDKGFIPMTINEMLYHALGGGYVQNKGEGYVLL